MKRLNLLGLAAFVLGVATILPCNPASAQAPLLEVEAKIPLGNVAGRIDHLAVDLKRRRVFVAELGNNTLGVVDLAAAKLQRRLTGLSEPQGVGYDAATDIVYVANAGNGAVEHVADGEHLRSTGARRFHGGVGPGEKPRLAAKSPPRTWGTGLKGQS